MSTFRKPGWKVSTSLLVLGMLSHIGWAGAVDRTIIDRIIQTWNDKRLRLPTDYSYQLTITGGAIDQMGQQVIKAQWRNKYKGLGDNYALMIGEVETFNQAKLYKTTECYILNPNYTAVLLPGKEQNTWYLKTIKTDTLEWTKSNRIDFDKSYIERMVQDAIHQGNIFTFSRKISLLDLLVSVRPHLKAVVEEGQQVRIEFTCPPKATPVEGLIGGTLVFDMSKDYFLISGSLKFSQTEGVLVQEFINQTVVHRGNHILSRSEIKNYRDGILKGFSTWECSPIAERVAIQDFYISAFGSPEPVGVVPPRRTPVYVWLLVAAGVLLTLGIFFRWLARRLRRGHSEG